jgi:hypothetical protein
MKGIAPIDRDFGRRKAIRLRLSRIQSALIAAAMCLPLVFQDIRLEGYETERAGFVGMIAAPLWVVIGARWLLGRRVPIQRRIRHAISPARWALIVLIGAALLTTILAISPRTSIEGLPNRGQGLLTYLAYGALYLGAARVGRRLLPSIAPILAWVAIPLCLYALYQRFDVENPRPGSLLGNANFFASWLILAMIWIGGAFARARRLSDRGFYALTLVLMAVALMLTGSRGAVFALAGGALVSVLAYTAVARRGRLARRVIGVTFAALLAYSAFTAFVPQRAGAGELRVLRPIDPFRLEAWAAGARAVGWTAVDADGMRDPFAALRPIIGYGLDVIPFLQAGYGVVGSQAYYIDTFHQIGYDALMWTGGIGAAAWIALYLGAAYAIMRRLQLIRRGWALRWSAAHLIGAGGGAAAFAFLLRDLAPDVRAVLPVGALCGLPLATLTWIGVAAGRRGHTMGARPVRAQQIGQIAALGVLVAGWIDLQFGFMTVAAGALWWIVLGTVDRARRLDRVVRRARRGGVSALRQRAFSRWAREKGAFQPNAPMVVGVLLIAGIGVTMHSAYVRHEVGAPTLSILLAILLAMSAALHYARRRDIVRTARAMGMILIVWIAWGALEYGIALIAGARADAALTDPTLRFADALMLLSLKGIGAAGFMIALWMIGVFQAQDSGAAYPGVRRRLPLSIAMAAAFIGGAAFYAGQFRTSTQTAIADTFARLGDSAADALAARLYAELDAPNAQFAALEARLRWETSAYVFNEATERLLTAEPYFIGTRRWLLFYERFTARFRQPPAYSLNVIRNGAFDIGRTNWDEYADLALTVQDGTMLLADTGEDATQRALVYQDIGIAIAAGTRFDLAIDAANPSGVGATLGVFIHAPDWSEALACSFVLEAGAGWTRHTMRAFALRTWEDARIALYVVDGETVDEQIAVDHVEMRITPTAEMPLLESMPSCN